MLSMAELCKEGALSAGGGWEMFLRDVLGGGEEGSTTHLKARRGQEAAAGQLE